MNPIGQLPDGTYTLEQPVVFHCGCGSVLPDVKSKLMMSGVPHIALINTNNNKRAKPYIHQIHLNFVAPSLNKTSHAVLYNPLTGKFIDLKKAPNNQNVYSNIYKVANGD